MTGDERAPKPEPRTPDRGDPPAGADRLGATARDLREELASPSDGNLVAALFAFLTAHGGRRHGDEVSELEHALQCATLAMDEGCGATLVTAALLHDIGHLLLAEPEPAPRCEAADRRHERVGAAFLAHRFPAAVTEPIRLHVLAKRYLCTVDHGYYATLSTASKRSFVAQGSGLLDEERAAFEAEPYFGAAVALRRLDEGAKIPGLRTPGLEAFAEAVASCVLRADAPPSRPSVHIVFTTRR
jgi:gamma-butyrobetaine dioxygenase